MKRNIIETIMGAVVILVAIGFLVFAFQGRDVGASGGYEVHAVFANSCNIVPGTEVRIGGVKIGSVAGQRLDPQSYQAVVTMIIDDEVSLASGTSARILPDGLLGGNYVELDAWLDEEDAIPPGGYIAVTQQCINVVDLLARFIFSIAEAGGPSQ